MLFMKEMRQRVIDDCTLKESAAINQILGKKVSFLGHLGRWLVGGGSVVKRSQVYISIYIYTKYIYVYL